MQDGGEQLEVDRRESKVTGAEGIDMGFGIGFFAEVCSGATVFLSLMTLFLNESCLQLLSIMTTWQALGTHS